MTQAEEMPELPEEESTSSLGNEKLSPETQSALNAAQEHQEGDSPKPETADKKIMSEEDIAGVQEAIAAALGTSEGEESEEEAQEPDETAALKDQLIRTVAEMDNLRKRTERELADARKYAVTGFARDLVNVVENLQLALQSISPEDREKDEKLGNITQGVEMTYNELLRVFEGNGIVRIDPLGEKFNHNHHQAVAQVEDAEAEPGTVTQVLQAGYIIHDRLLRPAMVTVAKGGAKSESISTEA